MVSARARRVMNSIKPNLTKAPPGPTQKGSAGYDNMRDDIEKVKKIREGSIEKVPVFDNDIMNKKAVDILTTNHPHQDVTTTASPEFAGLTVDTTTLKVDSTNNRVGIGTTTPASKLHIQGGAIAPPTPYASANDLVISARYGATGMSIISQDTQAGWITFGDQDDSNVGGIKYDHSTNAMTFSTSNVFDRMVLDSDGNVGIGVSDPHSKLEVAGAISSGTATITSSSDITDVSGVNTLWVTTAGGAVVIGGLKGGVDGQVLYVIRKDTTNDLTLENEEGVAGSQDLIMHQGTDEIIDAGGVTLVCDGSDWYDCSHAKHV